MSFSFDDKTPLEIFRVIVWQDLSELYHYSAFVEDYLAKEKQKHEESNPKREIQPGIKIWSYLPTQEHMNVAVSYPRLFRHSLLSHGYSLFENHVLHICELAAEAEQIILRPSDLRDDGLRKAKLFFKKVIQKPFLDEQPFWQDLLSVGLIRNTIVHMDGTVHPEHHARKQISDFAHRTEGFSFDDEDCSLRLQSGFHLSVLKLYEQGFDSLFSTLDVNLKFNEVFDTEKQTEQGAAANP
jgi:hypothetical protein